jgi:hypothetical protein
MEKPRLHRRTSNYRPSCRKNNVILGVLQDHIRFSAITNFKKYKFWYRIKITILPKKIVSANAFGQ